MLFDCATTGASQLHVRRPAIAQTPRAEGTRSASPISTAAAGPRIARRAVAVELTEELGATSKLEHFSKLVPVFFDPCALVLIRTIETSQRCFGIWATDRRELAGAERLAVVEQGSSVWLAPHRCREATARNQSDGDAIDAVDLRLERRIRAATQRSWQPWDDCRNGPPVVEVFGGELPHAESQSSRRHGQNMSTMGLPSPPRRTLSTTFASAKMIVLADAEARETRGDLLLAPTRGRGGDQLHGRTTRAPRLPPLTRSALAAS